MAIQAKKAVRKKLYLKLALIGPSGSGKTYTALRLGTGIGGTILLVNTEGDRGYIYANEFDYNIIDLAPPFTPEKYIEAIEYGEKNGCSVVILDSASHEWNGRGGLLETHDKMPGNSYTNWAKINPRHNEFVDKQLYAKCHIISCLRGKDQYAMEDDEKGSKKVKKLGMGPEQRVNYEYEMVTTFMLDQLTHVATVMKDNTHIFEGSYEVLTEEHGRLLKLWAENGVDAPISTLQPQLQTQPPPQQPAVDIEKTRKALFATFNKVAEQTGVDREFATEKGKAIIYKKMNVTTLSALTPVQWDSISKSLEGIADITKKTVEMALAPKEAVNE